MHEPNAMQDTIRIRNLWKLFGGNPSLNIECRRHDHSVRIAVEDVSFSVKEGEIFIIMGLSGSGKSTLLRMLNGLIEPTSGSVEVLGQDLASLSRTEWILLRRQTMAMVFQSFALFPNRSALENAEFGLEVAGMPKGKRVCRAKEALERVGLGNDLHRKPSQLSGGMRQRVGLARALALDPPILLMDEAFSALDPLIRRDMQDLLLDLQKEQQRTVVFVSHDLDEAVRLGDRIALMKEGQMLQCDSAEALLLHPAGDAVSEFFEGVDRASVLNLGAILANQTTASIVAAREDHPNQQRPSLKASTLLSDAIPYIADLNGPVDVINDEDQVIGAVSPQGLLKAIARQ